MTNFANLVDTFVEDPSDDVMANLTNAAESAELTDEEVAYLARRMGTSGQVLRRPVGIPTADIPSTGGPSSLSTLLCPLYLRAMGFIVPKLGVPGRPAGGIDVLAQVPQYTALLTRKEAESKLNACGYVHFLAGEEFAPLDARLFAFRKRRGAISIPSLAIASLLAKKIAVGVSVVVLDVRVAQHGNFGANFAEAAEHSRRFCRVASLLRIKAECVLSDANAPYQPYIGRGESLLAMYRVLTDCTDQWLNQHDRFCRDMAFRAYRMHAGTIVSQLPSTDGLRTVFEENLVEQGSMFALFEEYAQSIEKQHVHELTADREGFPRVGLRQLRSSLVRTQEQNVSPHTPFPDTAGVILCVPPYASVCKGQVVATARCCPHIWPDLRKRLCAAVRLEESPLPSRKPEIVQHA